MATRDRQRDFLSSYRITAKGPSSDITTYSSPQYLRWQDESSGGENPYWRDQVAKHENATTGFTGSSFTIKGSSSGIAQYILEDKIPAASPNWIRHQYSGDILTPDDLPLLNPFSNNTMRNRVVNRAAVGFLNKATKELRSFQSGVFLGEIREAISMIKNPAKGMTRLLQYYHRDAVRRTAKYYRTGRRPSPRSVADANKVVADTWLEYQFGWVPLLNDIKSAAGAFARLSKHPWEYKKLRYGTDELEMDTVSSSQLVYTKQIGSGGMRYRIRHLKAVQGYEVRYIGEVKVEVNRPMEVRKTVLGFQPSDFIPTVWELIPWSFLVDYFTNVGDLIDAWCFPQGNMAWHCRTTRAVRRRTVLARKFDTNNPNSTWYTMVHDSGPDLEVQLERKAVQREVPNLKSGLSFQFEVPGSSKKVLNMAALAHMRSR